MSKGVVSLTVHRNTKQRQERRALRRAMVNDARALSTRGDLIGYAIVAIGAGVVGAAYDTGQRVPVRYLPELCKRALVVEAENYHSNERDDYDPGA